jgi:hypothetical protein
MINDENGKLKRSYRKWSSMLRRCYDPGHPAYKYYGGEGCEVCARWRGKHGYQHFVEDMKGEPPEGLTLGRIKREHGYRPDNCRWETWKEQAANRRPTGPKPNPNSLRQKAIKAGLPYHAVYLRMRSGLWTEERALTTPLRRRRTVPYSWHPGRRGFPELG